MVAVAVLVGLRLPSFSDTIVQLPKTAVSAALLVLPLTRYHLLAGTTSLFVDLMAERVIVSLDVSLFFGAPPWLSACFCWLPPRLSASTAPLPGNR
jgi:hypothetical protein